MLTVDPEAVAETRAEKKSRLQEVSATSSSLILPSAINPLHISGQETRSAPLFCGA